MDNYWTRLERTRIARRNVLRGIGIAGAGGAGWALAGCGDDSTSSTPAATKPPAVGGTTAPTSAATATAAASPTPQNFLASIPLDPADPTPVAQFKAGGTMTRLTDRPFAFEIFGPQSTNNVYDAVLSVYSRLVRNSNRTGMKSVYVPDLEGDLAASWEQPDDTTIVFQLQPGVKWQNVPPLNGRALTPDDIKYMVNRGQNYTKNISKTDFLRVASVDDVGGGKVRFKLNKPYPPMLQAINGATWVVMPSEIGGTDNATTAQTAVGTGPFIITKSTPNVEVVYKKNPDYFRKDSAGKQVPYMDGYTLSFVSDSATRFALVEGGKADQVAQQSSPVTFDNAEALSKRNPGKFVFQVIGQLAPFFYVGGHAQKPPWNDPRFRRAMSMLVDRATIMTTLHAGLSQVGPYFPWPTVFDKEPKLADLGPNFKFDVTTAKQLISAAGVAPGTEFTLDWYESGTLADILPIYEQGVAQAGIKVRLSKNPDIVTHFTKLGTHNWPDLIVTGRGAAFPDAEAVVGGFVPKNGSNYLEVDDPEFNKLYDQLQTASGDARKALNKQFWDRHIDQMYEACLPQKYDLTFWTSRLHNWRNTAAYGNLYSGNQDQVWLSS